MTTQKKKTLILHCPRYKFLIRIYLKHKTTFVRYDNVC